LKGNGIGGVPEWKKEVKEGKDGPVQRVWDGSARKVFQISFSFLRFRLLPAACLLRATLQERNMKEHVAVGICEREKGEILTAWLRAFVWHLPSMLKDTK
jgi:hypothetical protein